ncbi:hypothetical protein J8I82_34560 [Cupriavidus sp. LEh25]|nr:hypothetical protein [Cupriavidus sp. LEh25]
MLKFTVPATSPFRHAITTASLVDTFRLRLLPMAQQAPVGTPTAPGCHNRRTPLATMVTIPRKTSEYRA